MRTVVLAATLALLASCASPTKPFAELPLVPGVYVVEILSESQRCTGWPQSQVGTSAIFLATLSQAGTEWRGRPADASQGDFEIVARPTAAVATSSFTYFEGTFAGTVIDAYRPSPAMPPVTLRTAQVTPPNSPAVTTRGVINLAGLFSQGEIQGPVEFTRAGDTTVCPAGAVRFTFQRSP
jgi:hypothetical protein